MLKIQNFTKTYASGKCAVDHLNLEVCSGDLYGFIGHNGAGKTTTLRAVSGILEFESGDIEIGGHSIRTQPLACKRMLAFIPDNPDLYENLTGIQYLNFIADIFGIEADKRQKEIAYYADAFEITNDLGSLISSYSHGMKQKLALISAFIHHPSLLILDEPFVGLDPKASYTLKELMAQMCQEGSAIFFSTHVLEVAEKICNKIAIIKDGKLLAAGPTQQVKGSGSLEDVFLELIDHDEK